MPPRQHIRVFDTTLRDGQQCPGAAMGFEQNLAYAELAAALRLDVVEAGFPAASKMDFDIVHSIAKRYASDEKAPIVAGLCQLRDEQIDCTLAALEPAAGTGRGLLHTYVPVDPTLMAASLSVKADKEKILSDVFSFIKRARESGLDVEFSPEGYSRQGAHFDFVTDLIRAAIEGGASVINCPDTIGGACQFEGEDYFVEKMNQHARIMAAEYPARKVIWSVHCHNDFGLAVHNSMYAVYRGPARQIEGCFNGIGERAGNAALESLLMLIRHLASKTDENGAYYTTVDVSRLQEICDFVSRHMLPRQPHWPISGENAARHSSGGHTNAVLRNPLAYQPFDPREIGKPISFLFGPLSGGNHAKSIIEEAGYCCESHEKAQIAQYIKDLHRDRRKGITDAELLQAYFEYRSPIRITNFNYSKSDNHSTVELEGTFFDTRGVIRGQHEGRDSALAALKRLVDAYLPTHIHSHKSRSEREGHDAHSLSTIVILDQRGALFEGVGCDQDIEIAAMKAYLNAVNRTYIEHHYRRDPTASAFAPVTHES